MTTDPPPIPFLDLPAQHRQLKEQLMAVVSQALDTAGFIGGKNLDAFESRFAEFTDARHAIGVSNGTDAIVLALKALGIGPGKAVVTVPNSFIATAEAISHCGATVEFVDVDRETCLMDPAALARHLSSRASDLQLGAIIPVHLYGQCADMDAILKVTASYGVPVIEDAAQAHGASYKGRPAGGLGVVGCFSFYPGKNLGACGEAGAVTTNDPEIARKVRLLRDHGQARKYEHEMIGHNARLDAIQAGFLSVKLPLLLGWNASRRSASDAYDQAFASLNHVAPVRIEPHNLPSRHLYVVHAENRESLQRHLADRRIASGLHYPTPLHFLECYRHLGYVQGAFPNVEWSCAHLLSLPMFPELTNSQIERVIAAVCEWDGSR